MPSFNYGITLLCTLMPHNFTCHGESAGLNGLSHNYTRYILWIVLQGSAVGIPSYFSSLDSTNLQYGEASCLILQFNTQLTLLWSLIVSWHRGISCSGTVLFSIYSLLNFQKQQDSQLRGHICIRVVATLLNIKLTFWVNIQLWKRHIFCDTQRLFRI